MITEAKDLLEALVLAAVPGVTVARSAAEEQRQVMARQFPLVALVTAPGEFDASVAQTVRYFAGEGEDRRYLTRHVRGSRKVPVVVRCWADGETAASQTLADIMPLIPSRWEYDGFDGRVEIGSEEHSDHTGNLGRHYLSAIEVTFVGVAATKPSDAPWFDKVQCDGVELSTGREQL